jgi:hypothetical protein
MNKKNIKDFFKVVSIPAFVASLCCLSPIILVLLGISTVSFASSLSDIFYGTYITHALRNGLIILYI